jgi:surface antigen
MSLLSSLTVFAGPALAKSSVAQTYDAAPACRAWSPPRQASRGDVCGPWQVRRDPSNPFLGSFGQCTYWAIERRPDIWTNRSAYDPVAADWDAWTWTAHARAEGLAVDTHPKPGDIAVWSRRQAGDASGHVAYVEAVNRHHGIRITEMNSYFGSARGDWRTLPAARLASRAAGWQGLLFIHRPGTIRGLAPAP